jgi:ankyrin repeat protein
MSAAFYGHEQTAALLLATREIDLSVKNPMEQTALDCAVMTGHRGIEQLIRNAGTKTRTTDNQ